MSATRIVSCTSCAMVLVCSFPAAVQADGAQVRKPAHVAPLTIKKKPKVHTNLRTLHGSAKSQQEREASEDRLKKTGSPMSEDEIDEAVKNAKEQHEQARKTLKDKLRKLQDSAEKKSQSGSRLTID